MPLYRALGAWMMERGISPGEPGWMIVAGLVFPLVPVLFAIGVGYELVIRIDRGRRLTAFAHWLAAGALVAAAIVGLVLRTRALVSSP
jgi:hypothetical protein